LARLTPRLKTGACAVSFFGQEFLDIKIMFIIVPPADISLVESAIWKVLFLKALPSDKI